MVAKFAAMTKDCPIKMSSITKLERDESNYCHWELDFFSYIGFLPEIAEYVTGQKEESNEDYKQDFAEVMNCIIHWTIDRELLLSIQEIRSPYMRVEELRKKFSGVLFAARQAGMKDLMLMTYDLKTSSMDQHIMMMREKRDALGRIGVRLPDDVFVIILLNSMLLGFPDIATNFENCILLDENHIISSSNITKALAAEDVSHRQSGQGAEVLRVGTKPFNRGGSGDPRTCFWCDMKGHTIRECRKKKEHDKNKASSSQSAKTDSKTTRTVEVEADVAVMASSPWDDPVKVTVSPVDISIKSDVGVFDTGATHHVFNDRTQFLNL